MFELIVLLLAVYGASKLLVEYDGYKNVFYKLRQRERLTMLHCVICTAVWFAILFSIVFWLGFVVILIPFSIIGFVILMEGK